MDAAEVEWHEYGGVAACAAGGGVWHCGRGGGSAVFGGGGGGLGEGLVGEGEEREERRGGMGRKEEGKRQGVRAKTGPLSKKGVLWNFSVREVSTAL